ncbi:uncharacterized protein LOC119309508 [Triticum dicoccoides]|uniref:uncharacterized protein LOC119309508 n=1 Tax=Triticum dicoccoides TaxID=85692 RepID=UPI00189161F1|nr:uncharacterized protein LOC119309508 [Triticum dicoccoides]
MPARDGARRGADNRRLADRDDWAAPRRAWAAAPYWPLPAREGTLDGRCDARLPLPGSQGARRWEVAGRLREDNQRREDELHPELQRRSVYSAPSRPGPEVGQSSCQGARSSVGSDDRARYGSKESDSADSLNWHRSLSWSPRYTPRCTSEEAPGPVGPSTKRKKKHSGGLSGQQEAPVIPPARASRARTHDETLCINCGCAGHFHSECLTPSRCPTTLAYLGYGVEGGGFYYVDATLEDEPVRPHLATITLVPDQQPPPSVVVTAETIRAELSAYIGDYRDSAFSWEVTETAPMVFSVPFPSAEMLNVCSHDHIKCPINNFMISIQKADAEPDTVAPLTQVWMLIYGLPSGGKRKHILKAISEPVGKILTVDLDSLEGDGPARVKLLCQAPADVDGLSLIFYFGKNKGKCITYKIDLDPLEGRPEDEPPAPTPAPPVAGRDNEDSQSEDNSPKSDDGLPPTASTENPRAPASAGTVGAGLPGGSTLALAVVAASSLVPELEEETLNARLDVRPPSPPRSPGVVCYSRSHRLPRGQPRDPACTLTGSGIQAERASLPISDSPGRLGSYDPGEGGHACGDT